MEGKSISQAMLRRLPLYLNVLRARPASLPTISATALAAELGLGEVLVRKDLALICGKGRPRIGYNVQELTAAITTFLRYDAIDEAVIVGAGKLGRALLAFDGYNEFGLNVHAAFDVSAQQAEAVSGDKQVLPLSELENYCRSREIGIGVLAVPASAAQQACDRMVACGISAVMNFAPVHLSVPDGIVVQNENFAAALSLLSKMPRSSRTAHETR